MDSLKVISAYVGAGVRRLPALLPLMLVALALLLGFSGAAWAQTTTPTATDYTGTLDAAGAAINFAGSTTSFVTVLFNKVTPYMVAVLGFVVLAGIVWRLSAKARKIAG